jgi:hypothetical protein
MKITILGTGMVGQILGQKLNELGHDVTLGTRDKGKTLSNNEPNQMTGQSFVDWYRNNSSIKVENYEDCATGSDLIINATSGYGSLPALKAVGEENLRGKVLLDVANPLDFSQGMPPKLFIVNDDSLGEQIQRSFPGLKVVKGFNTLNAYLMVNPGMLSGEHDLFICGNDAGAKEEVVNLMVSMGWKRENIIDMGDISNSRGTEQILPLWIRLMMSFGTAEFNIHVVRS